MHERPRDRDFRLSHQIRPEPVRSAFGDAALGLEAGAAAVWLKGGHAPGDLVRVQGEVDEYNGLTELKNILQVQVCSTGNSVAPAQLNLPVASLGDWERWEGMRVTLPQTFYVSDNYYLGRYGKIVLAVNGALQQPTDVVSPGAAAVALQDLNDAVRILKSSLAPD